MFPNAEPVEAPKVGVALPKAGDDDAPKTEVDPKGEEDWAPKTPVDMPPKIEPPVCEPKGLVLPPKGLGAKGLLVALLVCPKTGWDPNGLLDDCPKAATEQGKVRM